MQDNIIKLYNALKDTYDLGDENSFRTYLESGSNREALRKELETEWEVGDSASFARYLGFEEEPKVEPAKPTYNREVTPDEQSGKTSKVVKDEPKKIGNIPTIAETMENIPKFEPKPIFEKESTEIVGEDLSATNGKEKWIPTAEEKKKYDLEMQQMQSGVKQAKEKLDTRSAYVEGLLKNPFASGAQRIEIGNTESVFQRSNPRVVETESKYNTETGEYEKSYLNEFSEYDNKALAEYDQKQADIERYKELHPDYKEQATRKQVANMDNFLDDELRLAQEESSKVMTEYIDNANFGALMVLEGASMAGGANIAGGNIKLEYIPTAQAQELSQRINNLKTAKTYIRDANRIIAEADANAKEGTLKDWLESSFVGGAARGFGQKLFDIDTWDSGLTDLRNNTQLLLALDKADKGEELSDSQVAMLDAKAIELATNAYFGSYVGKGYKAGTVTAESIPFMLEMCLNPASATGSTAANKLARYALKRFAKKAAGEAAEELTEYGLKKAAIGAVSKKALKKFIKPFAVTGRAVGDIAGSAGMASTTGALGVSADAVGRMAGDVTFDTDESGKTVFAGRDSKEEFGEAFAKAFVSRTIENYSEKVGEYFAPVIGLAGKVVGKGLDKVGLGIVNRAIKNIKASDWAKAVDDFESHASYSGTIGEFSEEIVGGILNAIFVGDQTLDTDKDTGVFNSDNLIDTYLGVALMGGVMSGIKTLGYKTPKYRARQNMIEQGDLGFSIFGNQEKWGQIRNAISFGSEEDVKAVLAEVKNDDSLTQEQKMQAFKYAQYAMHYRGILEAEQKRREEQAPLHTDLETSFDNGYSLEGQEMNDANNNLALQREAATNMIGEENVNAIDNNPIEGLRNMQASGSTELQMQTAIDYANAKATYDGMQQRVTDDIDGRVTESDRLIDERTSKTDGSIHPVTLKGEKKAFIIDGSLTVMEDGSVDNENSDKSILIRDAETNEIRFVSPSDIVTADATIDAAEEKKTAAQAIRDEVTAKANAQIEGKLAFNAGDTYNILGEDGAAHTVTISGINENGEVIASVDESQPAVVDPATIQQQYDSYNLARLEEAERQKQEEREAKRANTTLSADNRYVEGAPSAYEEGAEIVIRDEDGNEKTAIIAGRVSLQDGQFVEDNEGNIVEYMVDGEVAHDNIADLNSKVVGHLGETNESDGKTDGEASLKQTGAYEPSAATSQDAMPMMGEEPDFLATTPERGHRYLYNEAGIPKAAADNMVTAHINAAEKEVKKQSDALAKLDANPGTSISAYKAKQADIKGKLDAAQAAYDYWNGVKVEQGKSEEAERQAAFAAQTADASGRQNELAAQKTPKEKIDAAKQMYGEYFDSDFTVPYDAMELVAMNMPNEKISWEGREGVRGLQQELGSNFKRGVGRDKGTNAFNIYLAKKGEGISTDEAIHSIYESAENTLPNGEHRWDVEEIRGAFIDMFMGAEKPSDIRDYVLNNRIRQAEEMRAAEDEAAEMARLDDEIMQRTGMEREEYGAWIAELEARADAQAAYENEVYNETNTSNDRETEGSIGEEGSGQVQGQEGDTTGVEEDGTASRRGRRGENFAGDRVGEEEVEAISHEEAISLIAKMEEIATVAPDVELTIENWDALFGEDGIVNTPIGEVKMGENQFAKLMRKGRDGKLGMIKPTLEEPHIILEEASEASDGDTTERASSYIFIRSFSKADGSRFYYFTSISVSKDGREVVISNQEKSRNKILRLLQEGSVIWRTPKDATTSSAERQGLDYEQPIEAETATKGSGITPQSTSSASKGTEIVNTVQENEVEISSESENKEEGQNESTINGAVDMSTLLPVMSDEAFAELLESGDKEMMEAYLKEIEHALRLGDNAPLDGKKEVQYDYKKAVEQYGKDNIPEEVLDDLTKRIEPYNNLERTLFDRKYALEEKLRGVEAAEHKASAEKKDKEKAAHKQTAYNGFLADKTALGADAAEKALSKRINIEGEVMTVAEFVEKQHQSGSLVPSISEEPKYKGVSKRAWNRMDAAQQAAEEERVKNGGTKSVYRLNGYELGKTAYDYAQYLMKNNNDNVDKVEKAKPKETASIKEVVRNYVQVYRNWADDIKNDAALNAWQNARKELEGRLNELSDEELEGLKSQLGGDFANIADFVGDISRRRTQNREVSNAFDEGMKAQKEISGTAKAPKVVLDNFTANDEQRLVLNGVHHDEDGFAVATNGTILIADKRQYDEANKGKTIISHKVDNSAKKGDIVDFRFPNWKMVVKAHSNGSTASVTFDGLRKFLAGVEEVMKSRWNTEKENGNTKQSFASWSSEANIAIRMPNEEVCVYKYNRLSKFADAAANMGMTDIYYAADKALMASNENGYVLLMPTNPNILTEEESLSYDAGRRFFYEWNSSSADRLPSKPNEQGKTETEKPQKSASKRSARASSVGKIDDFGEKIGGARKDLARGRIRDIKGYTTKDLTTLKKGADDILSQANILRLYKDGQMDEQTARGFLAMNNAVKVAIKKYGRTAKEIILNKYRDAAVAWEEGRAAEFGITDADVAAYMAGFDITEEKARKDLDYCITETFDMYMLTYQAMNYPAVERKLGQYVIVDYGSMRSRRIPLSRPFWVKTSYTSGRGYPFATLEGAMEKLNQLCPEVKPKDTEKKEKGEKAEHGLRVTKEGFGFYVKSRNIPGNIYLSPKFTSEKQAQAYMEENLEQLKAREQRLVDALMGSNIGMAEREGVDYRNGKDVTPQDFLDEFGFRGVEFGNWVPQGERQMYLNKTYDAIKDFCAIVGISPKAFSLGGRLGLAFGARGSGRALAHYEPGKEAINLTRMSGVGSLAHEWFHALDNILAKQETGNTSDMATTRFNVVREDVSAVLKEMYRVMKAMDYDVRSRRAGEYWGRTEEEFARLFQNYIYNKLAEKEVTSPILVRQDILFDDAEEISKNRWPYPSVAENATIAPLFDKLFSTIQEKTDEKGNVVLFQKLDGSTLSKEADATEMMMRDALIEMMEGAGIEVVTDVAIGQQVLDENANATREMRVYHGSGADFDAFDHSHMGEGEGAQAYGWGTYVTEVEGIGKTYAQSVGQNPIGRRPVLYKGEAYDAVNTDGWSDEKKGVYVDLVQGMRVMGKSAEQAKDDLRLMTEVNIRNRERSLANLKGSSENYQSIAEDKRKQEERLKHINEFNADDFTREGSTPTLYTVEIPEENAAYYIGYNERMREQQEIVEMVDNELAAQGWRRQEIGEQMVFTNSEGKRIVFTPNQTGADFYEEFVVAFGSKKAASEFLSSVGITGIKYPAEFRSGGRTDGASNYVIFDERDIEITNKARLFRTSNGEVYGYTMGGKIYLDTRIATTETPIHEYSHLWSEALEQANPKAWEQLKNDLVKDSELMDYVKGLYPEIKDENELMHEVFAHFSGKRGRARLEEMRKEETEKANGLLDKARIIAMFHRLKELLGRYWTMARDLFAGSVKGLDKMKAEDFADMAMADLLGGFNPSAAAKNNDIRYQFVGEQGAAEADKAEGVVTRIVSLATAKQMEADGRPAINIKMATGWERGKDGKWRYETEDFDVSHDAWEKAWEMGDGEYVLLPELIGKDDILFKEYQDLANVKVYPNRRISEGGYYSHPNEIHVSAKNTDNVKIFRSTLLHEVQHAIQRREGFERGTNWEKYTLDASADELHIAYLIREEAEKLVDSGEYKRLGNAINHVASLWEENGWYNPRVDKDGFYYAIGLAHDYEADLLNEMSLPKAQYEAKEKYLRNAGEVEARNVQTRAGMTAKERRRTLAEETEDYLRGEQIVTNGDAGGSASVVEDKDEMQSIKEKAIADGTYMKAPNGKPSNLNEWQWRVVRTEAFKNWFGDWEKAARIEKLRSSEPVQITGNEIKPSDDLKEYKKNALEYGKGLRDIYTNKDSGITVHLGKSGVKEVLNHDHKNIEQLQSIAAIPQIIENSIYIDSVNNEDTSKNNKVSRYHYYVCGLKIGDTNYTVRAVIAEQTNGERYYDHKLTKIEKGTLIDSLSGITTPGFNQEASPVSGYKDKRLLSILQTNSSKIVDENGEPLVVYHYTPNEFTKFDNSKIGSSTDVGAFGEGFYLSPSDKFSLYGKNKMTLFVNAKNPMRLNDSNAFEAKEAFYKDNYEWNAESAREFAEDVQGKGYDAVYYENRGMDEVVVYSPNQIKSATGNTEFSADEDINFMINDEGQPMFREGGVLPTYEESLASSKAAGYTKKQHDAWWNRAHKNMRLRANDIAKKLHLEGVVDIYETADDLNGVDGITEEDKKSKGWYDPKTGRIAIILGNHASAYDVMMTMLHEGVAHYGLRQLFGKNFETFLWNVYSNATPEVRSEINKLMAKNGWNYETATEEYLAGLAEDIDFDRVMKSGWWWKIKDWFVKMLRDIGLGSYVPEGKISDNELRYVLWRSYYNLELGGAYGTLLGAAIDVAKQYELGVGKFAPKEEMLGVAESGIGMSLEETNRRFNDELANLSEENADWVNLSLGMPSPILLAAGVENKHMKLYGNKVIKKMKKHGFALNELRDLPVAVANPIAVFNNYGKDGNRSILTELKTAQGNILVAITIGRGDVDVDFNVVSSVFAKNNISVVEWINKGYATYINKEKALNYLHHSAPIAEALSDSRLSSAAKVVENFVNPKISAENVEKNAEKLHRSGDGTQDAYNEAVNQGGKYGLTAYNFREAFQDSMLALRKLQEVVENKYGVKLSDAENAYEAENQLSSKNDADRKFFKDKILEPMNVIVDRMLRDEMVKQEDLNDYLICKHGLERNVIMAERDARKEYDELVKAGQAPDLNALISKYRKKDYSGLKGVTKSAYTSAAEAAAKKIVDNFEAQHGASSAELWDAINKATKWTLSKAYSSGMMSRETYDKVRNMFQYYIPLRGWSEEMAEDVYNYIDSDYRQGTFNSTIKSAKGHEHKSDDPLAIIGNMGDSAILQGNKNLMKQKMLNMATKYPTDVCSEGDVWLVKKGGKWVVSTPTIPANATDDQIAAAIEQHDADMQLLRQNGDAKRLKDNLDIEWEFEDKKRAEQHAVIAYVAGVPHMVYVHGNPRAAQAVNGLTGERPRDNKNDWTTKLSDLLTREIKSWYSSMVTSFNLAFSVPNFVRDLQHSIIMTYLSKGVKGTGKLIANLHKAFWYCTKARLNKQGNSKMDKYFDEFLRGGGATGYAHLDSVDKWKKLNEKRWARLSALQKAKTAPIKILQACLEGIGWFSETLELVTRFNTYVTEREEGASVSQSVKAAKNITVNFNKKGSENTPGIFGAIAKVLRIYVAFFNPMVQGVNQVYEVTRSNKKAAARLSGICAYYGLLGAVMPYVNMLLIDILVDDDDEKEKYNYFLQNEYTRRTNLMLFTGSGFVKVPLPQFFREFYGVGDAVATAMMGNANAEQTAESIVDIASNIFSIEGQSAYREWSAARFISPDWLDPIIDVENNENFMGSTIWNESIFNKEIPEYKKAKSRTWKPLVSIAENVNELQGGTEYVKGEGSNKWNSNPAAWQHIIEGYGGGVVRVILDAMNVATSMYNDEDIETSNIPIANRFWTVPTEESANWAQHRQYKAFEKYYDRAKAEHDGLKKDDSGVASRIKKMWDFEKKQPEAEAIYLAWNDLDIEGRLKDVEFDSKEYWDIIKEAVGAAKKIAIDGEKELFSDDEDVKRIIEGDGMDNLTTEEAEEILKRKYKDGGDGIRDIIEDWVAKDHGNGNDYYSGAKARETEHGERYYELRTYEDLVGDNALSRKIKDAEESGDAKLKRKLESKRNRINEEKKKLAKPKADEAKIMEYIRRKRNEALSMTEAPKEDVEDEDEE